MIIVGGDSQKGSGAECELRQAADHEDVHFVRADLRLMQEAARLGDEISARRESLHYLVLCAGIVRGHHTLTQEGVESNFAIGYLKLPKTTA